MKEDKEINALVEEKERILKKIDIVKNRTEDEKKLEEEALQLIH